MGWRRGELRILPRPVCEAGVQPYPRWWRLSTCGLAVMQKEKKADSSPPPTSLSVDRKELAFSPGWRESTWLSYSKSWEMLSPCGQRKGRKKDVERGITEKAGKVAVYCFGFDESRSKCSGMAAPGLSWHHNERAGLTKIYLFHFLNFPVASPPKRRCRCPPSILFGAGPVSGLESSCPFYPWTVLDAERSWSEVPACHQIKKWKP